MVERLKATIKEWGQLAVAISAMAGVASVVVGISVTLVFSAYGAVILERAGVATAREVTALRIQVEDVLQRMKVLARPEQIAHYRDAPNVLGGECFRGRACTIVVFAERDIRALECRLIPNETRLEITQNARTWSVPPERNRPAVNLSTSPQTVEPTFVMPQSIEPGEASAIIVSHYTDCLWQTDGEPPATQDSPRFKITISEWTGP